MKRQTIVGGLLVVGGILALFGLQFFEEIKTFFLSIIWSRAATFPVFNIMVWFGAVCLWGILFLAAIVSLFRACAVVMGLGRSIAIDYVYGVRVNRKELFSEVVSSFFVLILFICLSVLVFNMDKYFVHFFAESIYNSMFSLGQKAYVYAYPAAVALGGFYLLRDSYRKWEATRPKDIDQNCVLPW